MECAEARRLLAQGIMPGSATATRAALGFHLAGCAGCRAYRQAAEQDLLSALLAQSGPPSQAAAPGAPAHSAPQAARPRRGPRTVAARVLWYSGLGALAALGLLAAAIIGWAALASFTIHRNVQAMIIATAPAATATPTDAPAPSPTAAPPTAAPATPTAPKPSATPVPTPPPPTATPIPPAAGAPATILLLGSDQRPGEHDPSRTDAIIIVRVDPQKHRVAMLSLPRDLWVSIPGYGETRINAAHVWGEIYNDPDGGIGLARKTVSALLGIPIDYTLYVDFQGFIGAIDALGGVDVDVEKELLDENFPTMDYGYTVAHFLPGPQHMDGATALMYSRIRHPDSDFARMRRQQAVLAGVLATLRGRNVLASLKQLEDLTTALRGYITTDIPEARLLGLGWALRDFVPAQIEHYQLDSDMLSFGVGDDRWAEVAIPGALEQLARQLIGP